MAVMLYCASLILDIHSVRYPVRLQVNRTRWASAFISTETFLSGLGMLTLTAGFGLRGSTYSWMSPQNF